MIWYGYLLIAVKCNGVEEKRNNMMGTLNRSHTDGSIKNVSTLSLRQQIQRHYQNHYLHENTLMSIITNLIDSMNVQFERK